MRRFTQPTEEAWCRRRHRRTINPALRRQRRDSAEEVGRIPQANRTRCGVLQEEGHLGTRRRCTVAQSRLGELGRHLRQKAIDLQPSCIRLG